MSHFLKVYASTPFTSVIGWDISVKVGKGRTSTGELRIRRNFSFRFFPQMSLFAK